jgi:O-antigen/teichoic acid export membrane protein
VSASGQNSGGTTIRRSFVFAAVERYFSSIVQFASTVIIARLLTPDEVGIFSVGMSVVGLVHMVRDFGITQYIVQERELTRARYASAVSVTAMLSVSFALALWFIAEPLASRLYREPAFEDVLRVLAVNLLLSPLYAPAAAKLQREMQFGSLLKIASVSAATMAVASVGLAYAGWSYMSLVWASVAANVAGLALLAVSRWRDVLTLPRLSEARRVLGFGLPATGVSILSMLGMQAAFLIVPRFLGFSAVGLYGRAYGLVALFSRDIIGSAHRVLTPSFAHASRTGSDVKSQYLKSVAYLTALGWPFYGVMAIVAHPIIVFLFGPLWGDAAPVARVLCLGYAVHATWATATQVIMGLGKVRTILRGELIQQPVRFALILAAAQWGLVEVAWAQTITLTVAGIIYFRFVCTLLDVSVVQILRAMRPSVTVTIWTIVPAASLAAVTDSHVPSVGAHLALVGAGAAAGWLVGIATSGHPLKRELRRIAVKTGLRRAADPPNM